MSASGAHRLVDTPTVECLHGSLSSAWIVVFDETVVEALALKEGSELAMLSRRTAMHQRCKERDV